MENHNSDFVFDSTNEIDQDHADKENLDQSFNDTVVILDWDDTLLPSSWISQNGHRLDLPLNIDEKTQEELSTLETTVSAFLKHATRHGICIIITNAETGWVQLSCAKFMPKVAALIEKVKVISARSTYESKFPNSPLHWKHAAFENEVGLIFKQMNMENQSPRHVISFGDSLHEREAVHSVTKNLKNVHTKSIKFVDRPTIEQLRQQVEMIHKLFKQICGHDDSIDLMLTVNHLGSN